MMTSPQFLAVSRSGARSPSLLDSRLTTPVAAVTLRRQARLGGATPSRVDNAFQLAALSMRFSAAHPRRVFSARADKPSPSGAVSRRRLAVLLRLVEPVLSRPAARLGRL